MVPAMPRPTAARAGQQFGPPAPAQQTSPAVVEFGDATVRLERCDGGDVQLAVSIGGESRPLRFSASAVTRWCADARLLLGASLEVGARDEVELRTPMLVALDEQCIALVRRIGGGGSAISLLLTNSVEQIEGEGALRSGAAPMTAGDMLVAALRAAAG